MPRRRFGPDLRSIRGARLAAPLALAVALTSRSAGAQAPSPPAPWVPPPPPDPVTVDFGLRMGVAARLGAPQNFDLTRGTGYTVGLGVAVAPTRRFAVGIGYEHVDLGAESAAGDLGSVDLTRATDALWATLRLTAFRTERVGLAVSLGPGLVWQSVSADVIVLDGPGSRPFALSCSEGGSPGLGLRAAVGADVLLGSGFWLSADMVFDNLRLTSDVLGDCVQGAGSVSVLGGRVGLAYRFDASRWVR